MKQLTTTAIIIVAIVGLITIIVTGSKDNRQTVVADETFPVTPAPPAVSDSNILAESNEAESNTPIFYYGITCPHCHDVLDWMEEQNIESKIQVTKKEVYENQLNADELVKAAESCGLNTNSIAVPFLYAEEKCLIGTTDIINYLSEKAVGENQSD